MIGRHRIDIPESKLISMYDSGMDCPDIAEMFGCSAGTVYNRLKAAHVTIRKRRIKKSTFPVSCKASDLAYLAGIIDGEGTICIVKNSGHATGKTIRLSIANTSVELMKWIIKRFGGKVARKENGFGRKPIFQWKVDSVLTIRDFLQMTLPYLVVKKCKAETAIALCNEKVSIWNRTRIEFKEGEAQ